MAESPSETQLDPDKRPREQIENDQPTSAQVHRAREQGRGRRARAPWQIPWAGWKDILWRVYASVNDNRLLAVAGGVAFYSLLAIFPAVAAFVSLYGLIADASTIDAHLSLAAGVFPAGAVELLHEQITRIAAKGDAKLGLGFLTGLAVAIWSANAGMKAIIDALNVVYDEKEKRSFVKLNLLSLLFTVVAILSLMVALGGVVIAPMVFSAFGLSSLLGLAIVVLRWPLLMILATLALAAIYRYGPSRTEARWQWLSVGSVAAAIGWLITSVLFSWYIAPFRRLQRDLWVAWRGRRHDDVDVDLGHRYSAWRRAERRDRASDCEGFDGRHRKAAWRARRGDGRYDRRGAVVASKASCMESSSRGAKRRGDPQQPLQPFIPGSLRLRSR